MTQFSAIPAPKPRISAKLRKAIELRIRRGMTISAACEAAGISCAGWHKAMKRAAVRDYLEAEAARYIGETERLRVTAKARALEVALDLMENAKSETVRARMAEFLASEGKAPQVAVHVDARPQTGGYEYVPPGSQVVEVKAQRSTPTDE
ncbi:hypothetical protein KUV73_21260 [Mameliella alba]|nr:hypothetical protein [Mameliella alba]MBY6171686.1 hypothetical protein [Mameliella alba]MBY6176911.1 hypothetical protein [Mameliella alba]